MALEERIGNVSTGLNEETISTHLKQRKYAIPIYSDNEVEPCCICQVTEDILYFYILSLVEETLLNCLI